MMHDSKPEHSLKPGKAQKATSRTILTLDYTALEQLIKNSQPLPRFTLTFSGERSPSGPKAG